MATDRPPAPVLALPRPRGSRVVFAADGRVERTSPTMSTRASPARPVPTVLPAPADLIDVEAVMATDVVCVRVDLPIESAATLMIERDISAVPVVDVTGRAVGFVSKTDVMRWYRQDADLGELRADLAAATRDAELDAELAPRLAPSTSVGEVMTALAFTLQPDTPIAHAAALMAIEQVHHVVICDARGQVVGIVSSLDLATWIAERSGFHVPRRRRGEPR